MKKKEFVEKYGEVAYEKHSQQCLERTTQRREEHREEENIRVEEWRKANPDKVEAYAYELCHKGGKYYEHAYKYNTTGIPGERHLIRMRHANRYRPFKQIIAPFSQIHHEWIPDTAKYRGVALVETNLHRYGIIDVIQILEGKITLQTEQRGGRG